MNFIIDDLVHEVQESVRDPLRRDLHMRKAAVVLNQLHNQIPDKCRNCGQVAYLNVDRCCSERCLGRLKVRI